MTRPEQMAAIGKFGQEMTEAGVLLMTGGLVRPTKGTGIGLAAGKFTVTDGPYAETKELIDGFALIRADSLAEALEHAKRCCAETKCSSQARRARVRGRRASGAGSGRPARSIG